MLRFKDLEIGETFFIARSPKEVIPLRCVKFSPRRYTVPQSGHMGTVRTVMIPVIRAKDIAMHHIDGNPLNNEVENIRFVPLRQEEK